MTEDEALHLLSIKLSFQGLYSLRKALQIVPNNITRQPLRSSFVWEAFSNLCSATNVQSAITLTMEELSFYTTILERYCTSFLSINDSSAHRQCQTFLSPPVSACMQCDKKLSMHNNPSTATLFTLDGPVLCSKVSLECRSCSIRFGVCNFTDECGTHFYPFHLHNSSVQVTNVTYFHVNLYRWMPSLR